MEQNQNEQDLQNRALSKANNISKKGAKVGGEVIYKLGKKVLVKSSKAISSLISKITGGVAIAFGWVLAIIVVILILIFCYWVYLDSNANVDCNYNESSTENIEFLIPTIQKYMKQEGIPSSYEIIFYAQVHQESGDDYDVLHSDPFQSSESYCGYRDCITDYEKSTEQAMKVHKKNMNLYDELKIGGDKEKAILQAYNFGSGYLYYLEEIGEGHSEELAYDYSVKMTEENPEYSEVCTLDPKGKACYGDWQYVEHVFSHGGYVCGELSGELTTLPEKQGTYIVTQGYGQVGNPGLESGWHDGVDLDGGDGAEIYAAGDGQVVYVGQDQNGANVVRIKHEEGLYTAYAHMKYPSNLEVGENVEAGDLVGYQGSSGNSTGSHLHFEVRKENSYNIGAEFTENPQDYLPIEENQRS